MGKVLFWVIVIIAGLLIARILARQHEKGRIQEQQPKQAARKGAPPIAHPESMVRCAHCGIHMPRSEAVFIAGKTWCTNEHAKLGERL